MTQNPRDHLLTDGTSWRATYPCGCVGALTIMGNDEDEAAEHMEVVSRRIVIDRVDIETAKQSLVFDCKHDPRYGGVL